MAHRRAPRADADLDAIWSYIVTETGNTEIADRFIHAITDRFYLLSENPYIGRRRDDDLRPGLRSFPVGRYLIIYRIDKEDRRIGCSPSGLWRDAHHRTRYLG